MRIRTRAVAAALLVVVAVVVWSRCGRERTPAAASTAATLPDASLTGDPPTSATGRVARAVAPPFPRVTDDDRARCARDCGVACEEASGSLRCPPPCEDSDDCEPGRMCGMVATPDRRASSSRCVGSECTTDDDCGDARKCEMIVSPHEVIGRCEHAGPRALGERCALTTDGRSACDRDGACRDGVCVPRTCTGDDDCPLGTRCRAFMDGQQRCGSQCSDDGGCPAGERCVTTASGSLCATVDDESCAVRGCPDGMFCHLDTAFRWDVRARCLSPCDPRRADACPVGQHCRAALSPSRDVHPFRCEADCTAPGASCPAGYRCARRATGGLCEAIFAVE